MRKFKNITIARKVCLLPGICFVAAVMITSLQVSLAANDETPVQLTATNVRVTSLSSVTVDSLDNSRIGVVETLRKPGHVILLVEMDVKVAWTEKTGPLSIRNIVLIGKDGESLPAIGKFVSGIFYGYIPSLHILRHHKWPEENPTKALNAAFLVPGGSGPFTLKTDQDLSVPIVVPTRTAQEPHISSKMSVKVTSAKLVDTLPLRLAFRVGKDKAKTSTEIVNPGGQFLEVTFDLTPNDSNGSITDIFYWNTNWFGIRYNGKFHSHTVGAAWMKGLRRGVAHNTRILNGQGDTDTATLYFPVTSDAKTFDLLCLMREVANGTVAEN